MITESVARKAEKAVPSNLSLFDEFLGTGVVQSEDNAQEMVVAIYVSKPIQRLSEKFLSAIPKHIEARKGTCRVKVPIKIVNLGELSVS